MFDLFLFSCYNNYSCMGSHIFCGGHAWLCEPVDMLQKGQDYDELSPTYIIFFCLFDFFEDNQYIYTFKKRCLENPAIELADEATVIFLNTFGKKGSVSTDIKSLFEYINNNAITSDFTKEVADTITDIKNDKKVRKEYMTYEMRMKDLRNEAFYDGKAEGETEGKFEALKNLMQNLNLSVDKAMDAVNITPEERKYFKDRLAKGM